MKHKLQRIQIEITFLYQAYKAVNRNRKLVMKFIFIFVILPDMPIICNKFFIFINYLHFI